jgi:hypothetical protein
MKLTVTQILNVVIFALGTLAMGSFWQGLVQPHVAVAISGGLVYLANVLIYLETSKDNTPAPTAAK